MARMPELKRFSKRHGIPILQIADLISYRSGTKVWSRVAKSRLPNIFGKNSACGLRSEIDSFLHVALVHGGSARERRSSGSTRCFTGDVLDRSDATAGSASQIAGTIAAPAGVLLYSAGRERNRPGQ